MPKQAIDVQWSPHLVEDVAHEHLLHREKFLSTKIDIYKRRKKAAVTLDFKYYPRDIDARTA